MSDLDKRKYLYSTVHQVNLCHRQHKIILRRPGKSGRSICVLNVSRSLYKTITLSSLSLTLIAAKTCCCCSLKHVLPLHLRLHSGTERPQTWSRGTCYPSVSRVGAHATLVLLLAHRQDEAVRAAAISASLADKTKTRVFLPPAGGCTKKNSRDKR